MSKPSRYALSLALGALVLGACATPGYDYRTQVAPNFPEAVNYTDVDVGRFEGPGGQAAEDAFVDLIVSTELDGQPWFGAKSSGPPQGVYEGEVRIEDYAEEFTYERDKKCVEYDGIFDCERRAIVESECRTEVVEVSVIARLIDIATGNLVFTSTKGGEAESRECIDIAEYPDDGQPLGTIRDDHRSSWNPYDAPIGMIDDATREAVSYFRKDIAPYMTTMRATIMTDAILNEVAFDPRFKLAVEATRDGSQLGACAQWRELAVDYPKAPAILHNAGSCAEAEGDMATAQTLYAEAADIARNIPLLEDKKSKPIFDALERVSSRRRDGTLINNVVGGDSAPEETSPEGS